MVAGGHGVGQWFHHTVICLLRIRGAFLRSVLDSSHAEHSELCGCDTHDMIAAALTYCTSVVEIIYIHRLWSEKR